MKASGLDLSGLLQTDRSQTGQAIILLNEKGDNTIVIIGAANMDFETTHLPNKFIEVLGMVCMCYQVREIQSPPNSNGDPLSDQCTRRLRGKHLFNC